MSREYADRCLKCGRFVKEVAAKIEAHKDGTGLYLGAVTGICKTHGRTECAWYDDNGDACGYAWEDFISDDDPINQL